VTSKPDFKVMVLLLLVFMQLTRDLFAIAKFLYYKQLVDSCCKLPCPDDVIYLIQQQTNIFVNH